VKNIEVYRWKKSSSLWRCVSLFLIGAGILPAFVLAFAAEAGKKTEKRTSFGTGVETGFNLVRYHDTCIFLRTFFISGDFFVGLNPIDTPTGKQFKKKKQIYQTFPDSIIVDVEATAIPCDISSQHLPPPDMAAGLLGTLSFAANWKVNSTDLMPSAVVSTKVEHLNHGSRWNYFLEIPAKDILLTSELVISVTAREHIQLAVFSAHL
jgi:hypothetical protein